MGSFLNDLAVDEERGFIYIADVGGTEEPALVIVDLSNNQARRFSASEALAAEDVDLVVEGRVLGAPDETGKFNPARIAVNPITLSADGETLYFGAMNGTTWYQLPSKLLREGANDEIIAAAIAKVGPKPVSDGASTDRDGNHYFTDLGNNAISVLRTDGSLQRLVQDERLLWPDALSFGEPGWRLHCGQSAASCASLEWWCRQQPAAISYFACLHRYRGYSRPLKKPSKKSLQESRETAIQTFTPGQRWMSETQSELGLGLVAEVDERLARLLFPATGEERAYARHNAPLWRAVFGVGDRIRDMQGAELEITALDEKGGLITYHVRDIHGAEFKLPEISLDPHLHLNRPQQKLLAGRLDKDIWFRLRARTWQQQGEWSVSEVRGLAGARISPIPHQLYIASEVAGRWAPRVLLADEWGSARPSRPG